MTPETPAKVTATTLPDEPEKVNISLARFLNVTCSHCGEEFGEGEHGFSSCDEHAHLRGRGRQISCDCDTHSDKCALGRVRTLATANYSRCCISLPSAFNKSLAAIATTTMGPK